MELTVELTTELAAEQGRVLGVLVEKELTTPQGYPMTDNALVAACNQTTSRDPVVQYDVATVRIAVRELRELGLVRTVHRTGERSDKHRHELQAALDLSVPQTALLAVLLLRGPQTAAQLGARTERMHPFAGASEVEAELHALASRAEPLAVRSNASPAARSRGMRSGWRSRTAVGPWWSKLVRRRWLPVPLSWSWRARSRSCARRWPRCGRRWRGRRVAVRGTGSGSSRTGSGSVRGGRRGHPGSRPQERAHADPRVRRGRAVENVGAQHLRLSHADLWIAVTGGASVLEILFCAMPRIALPCSSTRS